MKKKPASIDINLVPKDPFFQTPLGKILRWALSVGRYIVIFTELIVIISFVGRFSLDRQATDLNDAIHQKETIIKSYGDVEEKVRSVQAVIEQYQQIQQQSNIADLFPALSSIMPTNVKLEELTIRQNSVSLVGSAVSQASLNVMINNIQLSPHFRNVVIDKIETKTGSNAGFEFRIRAETGQAVPPPTQSGNTSGGNTRNSQNTENTNEDLDI